MREIAIIAFGQTPNRRKELHRNEAEMLAPVVAEVLERVGLSRSDVDFTCSGSSDFLAGHAFSFVTALDALGAWPPIQESHVEGEAAWALYEAWVKMLCNEEIEVALVYGFARIVWAQAVAVEVYSLQLLLTNAILYLFFRAMLRGAPSLRSLGVVAYVIGLAFANHMTTVLLLPGLLVLYFKRPAEPLTFTRERLKALLILGVPLLAGISLYLYLPVRSAMHPEFNWGWVHRGMI